MPVPGNVSIFANSTLLAVVPQDVTIIGDPFLLVEPIYRYANLDLPFSPNDPGLQFTLTGVDPLIHNTLAARFFNLLNEFSPPLFLGGTVQPVNPPIIFEPPLRMCLSGAPEIWTVVSDSDPNYAGCFPQFSTDFGSTWKQLVDITGNSIILGNATTGSVTGADLPSHVDVDADDTLVLNLIESNGNLLSYVADDRDRFRYPSYLANSATIIAAAQAQLASGGLIPCGGGFTSVAAILPTGGGGGGDVTGFCISVAGHGEGDASEMIMNRGPIITDLDGPGASAFQTFALPGGLSPSNVCAAFIVVLGTKTDAPFLNTSSCGDGIVNGCFWNVGVLGGGVWGFVSGPGGNTDPFTNAITIFSASLDAPDGAGVTAREALSRGTTELLTTLTQSQIGGCFSTYNGSSFLLLYLAGGAEVLLGSGGGSLSSLGGASGINYELIAHSTVSGGLVSGGIVFTNVSSLVSIPGPTGFGGPIRRAVFSMPVPGLGSDHKIGVRYAWLDDRLNRKPPGIMKVPLDAAWVGSTLAFRFAAFGKQGGLPSLDSLQEYLYMPSGLAFNQFSPRPTYIQSPAQALTQFSATGIQMTSVTEAFAGNTIRYNARSLSIPVPPSSGAVYYVTIYDPNLLGDVGQQLTRQAFIDPDQRRVQVFGYIYIGSIVAVNANFSTAINTDGGWPPPRYMLVNGT